MPDVRTIVIAGTGVAGATAALTLRKEGFDGRVVLVGEEPHLPYRRPALSKDVLRDPAQTGRIWLKSAAAWESENIELLTGTRISTFDTDTVSFEDGRAPLPYDRLLLATGSSPRPLPWLSEADGPVVALRSLADAEALRARLVPGASLVVVGAGLVGLEVAATARQLGCEVTVLEAGARPLARVLPAELSEAVTALHRARGVAVHTRVALRGASPLADGRVALHDGDGRSWLADTVLVAVGTRPRTELAERAGLRVEDGIVVDAYGRTSMPGVHAAGDVARYPSGGGLVRGEHWSHAQDHGAAVAAALLDGGSPYRALPWSWTNQYDVTLQICGDPTSPDDLRIDGDPTTFDFTAVAHQAGRPVGAVAAGRPAEFRRLRTTLTPTP
ncbi:FAD-dependent oxidoreductase [Actinocorallia sp. API 0066]|uniref:NAD(P)/FAD-dependent oxidoreductase n=1 Tax=Actinocorallia sp. API 0066 TaxID=2896846 RepID=UPI001E2BC695|nr:FAD-dependent oxidoreductase [Actinocorallia sp. API 0066]MCD0448528.1 FAD-dependent oxidoreductase [Actinocorallia sp. API 0066]